MSGRLGIALLLLLLAVHPGAPSLAASFILEGGEVVEGRLVASTRNTLTVLREIGGIRQIAASSLERVRIRTDGGELISGPVHALDGERLAIETPSRQVVWIEGDRVVADLPPARNDDPLAVLKGLPPSRSPAAGPANARTILPARAGAKAVIEGPGGAPAPSRAGGGPDAAAPDRGGPSQPAEAPRPPASGGLVPKVAAATPGKETQQSAGRPGPPVVRIGASASEPAESDGKVSFRFELSHVSDQPIRLVYATVDGQADAGRDYEAVRGVLTIAPGEAGQTIETILLDDREREDPEQFFLFVKPDGESATIEEKWHAVTIRDDD